MPRTYRCDPQLGDLVLRPKFLKLRLHCRLNLSGNKPLNGLDGHRFCSCMQMLSCLGFSNMKGVLSTYVAEQHLKVNRTNIPAER